MKVEECLNELEEILEESWNLPLFKGKVFVDVDRIKENFENIRSSLPEEIRQAKAIVSDRSQIINDAKNEADTIIKVAQEKARNIVSQDELVKRAESTSESILQEAKAQAREMKKAANEYVEDLMKRTDDALMNNITELRQARKDLRASVQN
ncbi:MAG: ATPase [Clostridia bacterium]|nr:ATPase [Clostridia bacterium]